MRVDSSAICLVQVSKFSISFVSERGEETTHTHQEDGYYRITTGHLIDHTCEISAQRKLEGQREEIRSKLMMF